MDDIDVSGFKRLNIPLVRRIYPQLIANNITSVQPLLGPSGLVYYLRFRYGGQSETFTEDQPTRRKVIRKKKYRSIDDPWEPDLMSRRSNA